MKVLILSPYPENILGSFHNEGDEYIIYNNRLELDFIIKNEIDFIVSYGYKFIISEKVINSMKNAIINLHISFLPFNRGCYPNLWSHIDLSPAGVSIHKIDKGIDTGDVLLRKKVLIKPDEHNFLSSYKLLKSNLEDLFNENWKHLRLDKLSKIYHNEKGSYHNKLQGDAILAKLPHGWETNISEALKIINND